MTSSSHVMMPSISLSDDSFLRREVSASYDTCASPERGTEAAIALMLAADRVMVDRFTTRLVEEVSGFDRFDAESTTRRSAEDAIDCMWGHGKPCVTRFVGNDV